MAGDYDRPPLYEANRMMRQPTGKTLHDWARIRPAPFQDYFVGGTDANINALTNTVTLEGFEDAVSSYFAIKKKTRDPDKLFPRETRIELVKAELQNKGSTNKPEGYDQSKTNAGYKFWVHNSFEFRPNTAYQFKSRVIQYPGVLYYKETEKGQKEIVRKWKDLDAKSEGPFLQAPVTSVENSYIDFLKAHIYRAQGKDGSLYFVHRGRDETYAHLAMGISSSFAKELVNAISWNCPTCIPRMRELSRIGKAREKKRSQKRKVEHTGEETPTKKKQKNKLVETTPSAQTAPVQQPMPNNDFDNSYFPNSPLEYLPNGDFSNILLLQSASEYQPPKDTNAEYSNLLAASEPTPLSQHSQNNGSADVHWVNYEGYDCYYLHCPPNHRLQWQTITMNYRGTVEIKGLADSEKHTPNWNSLPAEIHNIPLPPGIYFYNNPDHPVFLDFNTNTVYMNYGQPIEPAAATPSMQNVADWTIDLEQVQAGDLQIDPATIYATQAFEVPPTDLSNNNLSEVPVYDNSVYNTGSQFSSSSEVSDPTLAGPYASLFDPSDSDFVLLEKNIELSLNNYIVDSSYIPGSDFFQQNNMDRFNQQLPSNSDTPDANSNVFDMDLFDFDFYTTDEQTADANSSPDCPTSQPTIDPSGRFSTLNGLTFPVPASSRG